MLINEYFNSVRERVSAAIAEWDVGTTIQLSDPELDARIAELVEKYTLQTNAITSITKRPKTPGKASDGVIVTISLEHPDAARQFLEMEPSTSQSLLSGDSRLTLDPMGVSFVASSPRQMQQLEEIHEHNIQQRNSEIAGGNARLDGIIRPLVLRHVAQVREQESAARRQWEEAGIAMEEPPAMPVAERTGNPPESAPDVERLSFTSELVGADTIARAQERALNLVEELAGQCIGSSDDQQREAGELAVKAVELLRPYIGVELPADRKAAWGRVVEAVVRFVPRGREGLDLMHALYGLAQVYELPWTAHVPGSE